MLQLLNFFLFFFLGLRVIDASVMPFITSGNIQAPVIMIGEKGADLIKEDWLHSNVVRRNTREIRKPRKKSSNQNTKRTEIHDKFSVPELPKQLNCSFDEYFNNVTRAMKSIRFQKITFNDLIS